MAQAQAIACIRVLFLCAYTGFPTEKNKVREYKLLPRRAETSRQP